MGGWKGWIEMEVHEDCNWKIELDVITLLVAYLPTVLSTSRVAFYKHSQMNIQDSPRQILKITPWVSSLSRSL